MGFKGERSPEPEKGIVENFKYAVARGASEWGCYMAGPNRGKLLILPATTVALYIAPAKLNVRFDRGKFGYWLAA